MKISENSTRFWFLAIVIFVVTLSRLLPHPWNFTPVAAIALFAGAYLLNSRMAFILPLAALLISDILIEIGFRMGFNAYGGFYPDIFVVYISFLIIIGIGRYLRNNIKAIPVLLGVLSGSLIFYILTNFAVWVVSNGTMYPMTMTGLIECYVAAIPFFRGTLAGDVIYTGLLFGSFELIQYRFPVLARVQSS